MSFRCQHCHSAFPNPQSTQYSPKKVVTARYTPTAFAGPTVAEERELCDGCAPSESSRGSSRPPRTSSRPRRSASTRRSAGETARRRSSGARGDHKRKGPRGPFLLPASDAPVDVLPNAREVR
jgi:hypothetical protein